MQTRLHPESQCAHIAHTVTEIILHLGRIFRNTDAGLKFRTLLISFRSLLLSLLEFD